jgi:hypothetical protein
MGIRKSDGKNKKSKKQVPASAVKRAEIRRGDERGQVAPEGDAVVAR